MLEYHAASDRAVWYAVETGRMANMHLIHQVQRWEGFEPCFGRAASRCGRAQCRWHSQCMELWLFRRESESSRLSDHRNSQARVMDRTTLGKDAPRLGSADRHRGRTEPVTVDSP